MYDYQVARVVKDADCWNVACPTCGQPTYLACNNDPTGDGHVLRWAVAGAAVFEETI